eukprot:2511917-Rhodomonas_salina.1
MAHPKSAGNPHPLPLCSPRTQNPALEPARNPSCQGSKPSLPLCSPRNPPRGPHHLAPEHPPEQPQALEPPASTSENSFSSKWNAETSARFQFWPTIVRLRMIHRARRTMENRLSCSTRDPSRYPDRIVQCTAGVISCGPAPSTLGVCPALLSAPPHAPALNTATLSSCLRCMLSCSKSAKVACPSPRGLAFARRESSRSASACALHSAT